MLTRLETAATVRIFQLSGQRVVPRGWASRVFSQKRPATFHLDESFSSSLFTGRLNVRIAWSFLWTPLRLSRLPVPGFSLLPYNNERARETKGVLDF